MSSAKNKNRKHDVKGVSATPDSAMDSEATRADDKAVSDSVTVENGVKSILPGPPIPPVIQTRLKRKSGDAENKKGEDAMVDPSQIKEHMEVVGSDGDHVGTVDRCEENTLKLTRNDPAAGGEHHYIPLAWVNAVDQRVHLAHPGSEARAQWG